MCPAKFIVNPTFVFLILMSGQWNDATAEVFEGVGRYYQDRSEYLAAINRFKSVIENYQTTTHVPEALARLTECYLSLGLEGEAKRTAAVLGHNFPGSEYYSESYSLLLGEDAPEREEESWWDSTTNSISSLF